MVQAPSECRQAFPVQHENVTPQTDDVVSSTDNLILEKHSIRHEQPPFSPRSEETTFASRPSLSPGFAENANGPPYHAKVNAPADHPKVQEQQRCQSPATFVNPWDYDQNHPEDAWMERQLVHRDALTTAQLTRKISLVKGSVLSTEYVVPSAISSAVLLEHRDAGQGRKEFSHLRYTAACCDADEFTLKNGYNLRSAMYGRTTELLVGVTYYNENKMLTARTIHGVMENVRDIMKQKKNELWDLVGPAWQKVVVCLVADGIDPCDKETLDLLAAMGLYQDGIMKKDVEGRQTEAHVFEYTTQLSVAADQTVVYPIEGHPDSLPPVQFIFCLKQHNAKKINSHRWLLNAFGRLLNPNICVLLDVGTKPGPGALVSLWRAFDRDQNLGGACGEVHVMLGPKCKNLRNPLVAAQNFEYKMCNILDKPLESCFGYISVLPGAFSAYRYRALQGRPLEQYFQGDQTVLDRTRNAESISVFRKNMFLAEDRILSFEVVAKPDSKWHLAYIRSAKGETDVPDNTTEFLGQRRRWLNGAFAASLYSLTHFRQLYATNHSLVRLFFLHLQLIYNLAVLFMTWFSLASLWLAISMIIQLDSQTNGETKTPLFPFGTTATTVVNVMLRYFYLGTLLLQLILALGTRPKASRSLYTLCLIVLAIIQTYVIILSIHMMFLTFTNAESRGFIINLGSIPHTNQVPAAAGVGTLIITLGATFALYIVSSSLSLDPWHLFTSLLQYLLIVPSFINVLMVYAFCNWHDVSWGTKGADDAAVVLPSAQTTTILNTNTSTGRKSSVVVVCEPDRTQSDVDVQFDAAIKRTLAPYAHLPARSKPAVAVEDSYRNFRIKLVASWVFSNCFLVVGVSDTGTEVVGLGMGSNLRMAYFFRALLFTMAGLALTRFLGCVFYLGKTACFEVFWRCYGRYRCRRATTAHGGRGKQGSECV